MDFNNPIIIGAIIIALLVIFLVIITMTNKKKKAETIDLPFMLNDLLENIGGVENINSVSSSLSKVTFKLKDNSKVNVAAIESLGASGIVETREGFTFIFGNISKNIETIIKDKL